MGWQSCTDKGSFTRAILDALAKEYQFDLAILRFRNCPQDVQDMLIYGTDGREVKVYYKGQRGEGIYDVAFEGLIKNVERRYRETGSDTMKQEYESFMRITPCKACDGQRLKKSALAVTVADKNIYEDDGYVNRRAAAVYGAARADAAAGADRTSDFKGDPCPASVSLSMSDWNI